ncbi:ABC transporter permease [Halanaerobium salsuginis]|uniref:Monosaccharide ABC transporter membrane protein, CUT2 family n=1 Tax=Halanaerobium salsuginis TaxID=29563 RepID=A0A1I4KYM4_9FIRM|nr:ABC transporter permease [Halanaerobium salsuginis]SFL83838.1 monosaccharide ABC transporter membrane protein, CUT2 family [Halanaerobium salsuginis]
MQSKEAVGINISGGTTNWRKLLFDKLGSLLGLIVLMIILTFASPYFLTVNNLTNVLQQASINALVASGMLLAILTAGIDLSVGSVLALSISVSGIVIINFGLNPVLGILACLFVGGTAGMTNGLLLTKLRLPHPFIATLGMMNVARGLALIITGASPVSGFPDWIQFIGSGYIGPIPFSFILVIVAVIIFHYFLNRTTLGRHIYAVGGNIEAARLSGIDTDRVLTWVYTISGFMAAMGGIVLMGKVNAAYPLAGLSYELDAIAAVIIGGASFLGGVGTIWGTLIGAMIIAVIRNGLNLLGVSPDLQTVVIGAVIIGAVYIDVLRRQKK